MIVFIITGAAAALTACWLVYVLTKRRDKALAEASLVFVLNADGHVLLARKTRHIGAGYWNGYGGGPEKIDDGDMFRTAIRELSQESGLAGRPQDLEQVAICYFNNTKANGRTFTCKVHVYLLRTWQGTPRWTEEMEDPRFFPIQDLPLSEMMPADRHWVPRVLAGETGIVWASYGPQQKELVGNVVFSAGAELK